MPVFDKEKLFDKIKVGKSLDSIIWETPPEIFDPINNEFKFTLDVCAILQNTKCEKYFTPEIDGLKQSWKNEICWCNPPYGSSVSKWCKKAIQETWNGATSVLLIPCKTNTNWWHDLVIHHAEIRFLRGRVKFIQNGNQFDQALPWPLAFVIYNAKTKGMNEKFKIEENISLINKQGWEDIENKLAYFTGYNSSNFLTWLKENYYCPEKKNT